MAQGTPSAPLADYPAVSITAEKDGDGYKFGVPDSFPTGYVAVTLVNKSDADHHAMFMKMKPDVTTDQFIETAKSAPNPGAFAGLATSIGGPASVSPGQQATVILNLEEGPYVLICEVPGPDGTPHYQMGMLEEIEAKPDGTPVTTPPVAETTVDLVDFAFEGLPPTLTPEQHIWEVKNTGEEPHEMAIFLLSPGVTADAALAMLAGEATGATPAAASATPAAPAASGPPFIEVAGVAPMDPGQTVWPVLNLAAGDYLTVCFVPDPATGKPHLALGMVGDFTVA
jgi:uncharacterized cupredoxin-like copper-binding protein